MSQECPHCKSLSEIFFTRKKQSAREYFLATEMFVYLHRGDVCNFSRKQVTKTPNEVLEEEYYKRTPEQDPYWHTPEELRKTHGYDSAIESMHQYAEMRIEIANRYWAERLEEIAENHIFGNGSLLDDLAEEMKTAKYFP